MVKYILSLRPFGENGPKWEVVDRFLRVVVLTMHVPLDAKRVRALFVHCPPGKMFESNPKIKYGDTEFDNMAISALSLAFMHRAFERLRDVDFTPTTIHDILATKVESIVFHPRGTK